MSQTPEEEKKAYKTQYDSKMASLDSYYTDTEAQLKQKQQNAKEAANVSYQKLLKYLPQQTAGYSVGMTETAKIAANNSYQRQLAEADSSYNASVTDLNKYVADQKDAAADKLYEREWAEDQREYERDLQEAQDTKAEQESIYNEMMNKMRNGEYGTVADLEKYLFGAAGNTNFDGDDVGYGLTDAQKANLLHEYETIKKDPDQIAADEDAKANIGEILVLDGTVAPVEGKLSIEHKNNNFKIGGNKVELGEIVEDEGIKEKAASLTNKTPFELNGQLYIKLGGKIWTVQGRGAGGAGDGYQAALDLYTTKRYSNKTSE